MRNSEEGAHAAEAGGLPGAPQLAVATEAPARGTAASETTRSFIRGSSLLLGGRALSLLINFGAQVLTVRYLSKSDYGAFAYALGVASMGATAVLLGLHHAVPRFVPIFRERGEYPRMFGAIALAGMSVLGLGVSVVLLAWGLQGLVLGRAVQDPLSLSLLLVLILLTPLQALDTLLQGLLATFAGARAVFFRRHVLAPSLRLAAILLVLAVGGDAHLLAWGHVIGGAVGVAAYLAILFVTWKRQGLMERLRREGVELPTRELFGYSMPLLSSEVLVMLRGSVVLILLELLHTTAAVAEYRAIYPIARLNLVALGSFTLMYIPIASRLFARGDRDGLHDLFWQTSTWIAVITFPALALTTTLAEPLVVLLFGAKYAGSGDVLAVLAVGYYFHAAFGANTATLKVHGNLRYVVASDVAALALGTALHFLLIPRYGAIGAAVGASSILILHNVLHQVGLFLGGSGVRLWEPRCLKVYGVIAVAALALVLLDRLATPPTAVTVGVTVVASLVVVRLATRALRAETTFPELLRVPLVRRILR